MNFEINININLDIRQIMEKRLKNIQTFEQHSSELNISDVSDSFIDSVKKEMLNWYGFDLTYEQVKNYLESNKLNFFDTVEREDYVNFLGKTITGMYYPYNSSSDEYVKEFFKRLRENSTEKGYKWVG